MRHSAALQGWKFTAIAPNHTHPASFWGLRRMALTENTSHHHRDGALSRPLQNADQLPDMMTGAGARRMTPGAQVLRQLMRHVAWHQNVDPD